MTGKHVINYIRQTQSADALRLALCEVAQLQILPEDAQLEQVYATGRYTVYTFANFNIVVKYKHEALIVGVTYPAGTVIGSEYIKVYSQQAGVPEQWWRVLNWTDGLPMSGVFTGLVIPDALVRYYWVEDWEDSDGNTRKHIRADFSPSQPTLQDRFWQHVHTAEQRTQLTLADTPELAAVEDGADVRVNMLDFYFRNLLGSRGIVVDLRTDELGDKIDRAVRSFIRREAPVGSLVIVRNGGEKLFA
jgi:hypothetical protein